MGDEQRNVDPLTDDEIRALRELLALLARDQPMSEYRAIKEPTPDSVTL